MCPFCISAAVSVVAGTAATAGVGALFAFARKIPESVAGSGEPGPDPATDSATREQGWSDIEDPL